MPVLFHSVGSCAQVPKEWNGAGYGVGVATDGMSLFPEPGQGGVFYDRFVELAHSGLRLNKQLIENK
jgi:hypothetical protein